MNLLLITMVLWSGLTLASTDLFFSTQHITLTRLNQIGRQHDLWARQDLSRKTYAGLGGTYLERFSFYEKGAGVYLGHRPTQKITLEARFVLGEGNNEVLPREQRALTGYYALAPGFTPYATYRDNRYSVTRVHILNLGMEIEKFPHILLIPQVMVGRATFQSPAGTEDLHNYGLRAMYYEEKRFNAFVFAYKGEEASQGIVGRSNIIVRTLSGGIGGSWYWKDNFRTELILDHTDYNELKTQFITTTLNLYWTVDS